MIHIAFWSIAFLVAHRLLNVDYGLSTINYYYTTLFLIPLMLVFYLATLALKYFLAKGNYILIIFSICICLVLGVFLHFGLMDYLSDWILPGQYLVSFFSWSDILQVTALFLFIAVLIFLAFNRFELQEQKSKVQQENNLIRMKAMESKIQPHFLFNSLNNIYSNIDPSNKQAKEYLIKLSDSMRYMIYDIDAELVPLSEEIEYIKNYIDLEKLRFEDDSSIILNVNGGEQAYMISPLMLIPLVENCFKHVDRSDPKIEIVVDIGKDKLSMRTKNRFTVKDEMVKSSGVGLYILKSRLDLLYPQKHKLDFDHIDGYYIVNLTLDLSL